MFIITQPFLFEDCLSTTKSQILGHKPAYVQKALDTTLKQGNELICRLHDIGVKLML